MRRLLTFNLWMVLLFLSWSPQAQSKQLFANDFTPVCSGAGLTDAAAYEKSAGKIHPILVMYKKADDQKWSKYYSKLVEGWETDWKEIAKTELVVCVDPTERKKAKECPFEKDGNKFLLEMYDTKYDVKLYESKTGTLIKETKLDLKAANQCPMFQMFRNATEKKDADFKDELIKFVKPYVQP